MNGLIVPQDMQRLFLPQNYGMKMASPMAPPLMGVEPMTEQPYMQYGMYPACHKPELLQLMIERYMRADAAHAQWAEEAKRCVDFLEGKQWSAQELKDAEYDERPTLTLNKLGALVRLVLGYHRNNRFDEKHLPTDDANSTESTATVITKIAKQIALQNEEPYIDAEVFLDGIASGRGYYNWGLNFERNDFGDIEVRAKDPFCIRIDPDADTYDPDDRNGGWGYFFDARWANIDEVEFHFGQAVAQLIYPLLRGSGYRGGIPSDVMSVLEDITPWRGFGGALNNQNGWAFESFIANSVDPYRKNIRLIECQHKIRVMQRTIVDLETGDREPIPTDFSPMQVVKIMQWAAEQYAMRGQQCPLRVQWRPMKRVRWTVMIGDIIVYDDWSKYESYTLSPFFPYFRRGKTRGMLNDLIDPQREINKRRSSQIDILTRVAHSGWMWHENALDETEKVKMEQHGGAPGINVEWRGDSSMKPERIEPGQMPTAIKELEQSATLDLKEIAGINDSALGQIDRVQSGRAIEARQRQSVLGIEMYMDNNRRTRHINARKRVEMIQNHYTEPRIFKILGDNGQYSMIGINQRNAVGEIVNNVNIGRYILAIDESPASASWLNAQFEELKGLIEAGVIPAVLAQDVLLDLSTAPQKELLKQRLNAFMRAQGMLTADDLVMLEKAGIPPGAMLPPPGGLGVPSKGAGGKPGEKNDAPQGHTAQQNSASQKPAGASPAAGAQPGAKVPV